MKHILHHARDFNAGVIDLYLDVKASDFELDAEQHAILKVATAAKLAMGLVTRTFGGCTTFVHARSLTSAEELQIIVTVMSTLARPGPSDSRIEGQPCERY